MKIEFENARGKRRLIAMCDDASECIGIIQKYLEESYPDYDIPYFRVIARDNGDKIVDCGSHSEFFYVTGGDV